MPGRRAGRFSPGSTTKGSAETNLHERAGPIRAAAGGRELAPIRAALARGRGVIGRWMRRMGSARRAWLGWKNLSDEAIKTVNGWVATSVGINSMLAASNEFERVVAVCRQALLPVTVFSFFINLLTLLSR